MPKRFPAIELVAKHGRSLAIAIAALPALGAVVAFTQHGSVPQLAGALFGAVILYCVLRVGVEMIEVIAETLLPR